jgi:hypothetical protein
MEGVCGFAKEEGKACGTSNEELVGIAKSRKEGDNAYKSAHKRESKKRKLAGE